ncbi:hypothetical protein BDV93DRAFT_523924 [Ceratobasidium sp. AG-I]|nr:hypothetical protein BDV93DRAFT_523924 [Ceratobasidium sp. AG-I]
MRTMSTLSSLEVSSFFREVYGRAYPADTNVPPFLPLDGGEVVRLELQHFYLKLLIQSNYFGPVRAMLAPDPLRQIRVLDLCTSEGTWVQEMASEFPHVEFVSLDIVPLVPHTPRSNIMYEVYDLYNGFAEPDLSFDVVHTRRTVSQIKDYHAFLREINRVLRPGGLLLFGQLEIEVYEYTPPDNSALEDSGEALLPGPHVIRAERSLPVMLRGMRMLRDSLSIQGLHVHMWRDLPALLAPGSPLWTPKTVSEFPTPSVKHVEQRGYKDIVATAHVLPTAPWHPTNSRLRAIGEVVQQVGYANWQNFGLLFRQHGLSEEEASQLVDAGLKESSKDKIWKVMLYHTVYATKI